MKKLFYDTDTDTMGNMGLPEKGTGKTIMTKYFCNPLNVDYRYQFNQQVMPGVGEGAIEVSREAADPSMICFKGKYYIFASMTLGVWVSEDMANWEAKRLPDNLPFYDYAPDVRVIGDYVYFSASKRGEPCNFYRTKNIEEGPYEEIKGTFDFWDPNLFVDDDGKVYFYWGCANMTPIWGVEMDPETMHPKTDRIELVHGNWSENGYEVCGEDHCDLPLEDDALEAKYRGFMQMQGMDPDDLPPQMQGMAVMMKGYVSGRPYIEGAWMDKHDGKYYLQYACPGAQYNVYADGVYVSDSPLGPFKLAQNNPYSYKPGGFIPGAGHGSTMRDQNDNLWHTSTMRISMNHNFERRVGVWPAGFDADGELFCNQRYGDWPLAVTSGNQNPWKDPEWMLLSYGKNTTASSAEEGKGADKITDENVRTWWRAASEKPGEWVQLDLGETMDVRAIQVNFADDKIDIFLVEADNALKYVDTDYTAPVKDLGITDADLSKQYQYTKDIVTDSKGVLKGVSWQGCPGVLFYNREAAKDVLGTDDPDEVQNYVCDWDTFNDTAAKMQAKGYKMISSVNDTYRVYSNNVSSKWVEDGKVQVDDNIMKWVDDSKKLVDAKEAGTFDMWSDDWSKGFYPDGKVFCYFGPAWLVNFSMAADTEGSIGYNGGWGAAQGPQGFFWGGTWICAAQDTDNASLVKDIMLKMTTDDDVMKDIVLDDDDFVNNNTVMNGLADGSIKAKDGKEYSSKILGGQNPLSMYCAGVETLDLSNISAYDQGCNEEFQKAMKNYFEGKATKDEALELFYKGVTEKYPELTY